MTAWLWFVLLFAGSTLLAVVHSVISQEISGWLRLVPYGILWLAAVLLLEPGQRDAIYRDEWRPELEHIMSHAETRPITWLIIGTKYSLGLLVVAPCIARRLHRVRKSEPSIAAISAGGPASSGPIEQLSALEEALGIEDSVAKYNREVMQMTSQAQMQSSLQDLLNSIGQTKSTQSALTTQAYHTVEKSFAELINS